MAAELNQNRGTASHARRTLWGAPVAVAITFLLIGCYTILKHPITSEEGLSQTSHQEYYRDRCLDCHADYATYPYGFFYGNYPEYYFEYPRWGHYYAYPWWWDHYWYDNSDDVAAGGDSEDLPESGKKASRRSDLRPPYVGGAPAAPTGATSIRKNPAAQPKGGTGTGTGTASPGTSTSKTRVKAADQSTEGAQDDNTQQTDTKKKKKSSRRSGIKP